MKKMFVIDVGLLLVLAGQVVALCGSTRCVVSECIPLPGYLLNMLLFRLLAGLFLFGGFALMFVGARMRSEGLERIGLR